LIRVEPRGLGLGHSLTEVHQGMLNRMLEATASSCIGLVGVDINTTSTDSLARLPGMQRELAQKVIKHRTSNGKFDCIADLESKELLTADQLRWVAGFLRVNGGSQALDATAIHPESYELVTRVAKTKGAEASELFGKNHRDVDVKALITPQTGRIRIVDLLWDLEHPHSDPRGILVDCRNDEIQSFEDVKLDQRLQGRITNLTEFGAFADIGIGHHGLIHMSQIPGSRLNNPSQGLKVGEVVSVYVVGVTEKGKRIALSMHKPRHMAEGRQATVGERMAKPARRGQRRPSPERQVFSRAARAPEGRRGGRSGRKPSGRDKNKEFDPKENRDPLAQAGRGRQGARGGRGSQQPRIITVESDLAQEESLGHKGELRSLSGLRALLKRQDEDKNQSSD
jgi:uncharacterized protein